MRIGQVDVNELETGDYQRQTNNRRVERVCRGCQAINVYCGGTLHQHLPDAYEPVLWHARNIHGRHSVHINEGTTIARLVGAGDIRINSSHHQAIDRPGEGLAVSAAAPDGVIEAAEGKNILLVQWHPEWMGDEHNAIFSWLAGA
ncbi:MAG: gamma-glutamyl-gamma-aminobutyrate hydrolase family protein [Oscillospiraceae bacterium]|jgi:putative glutamine amidotransferase|nr:gamma-glutamyl-gamma-aminobutyrate hydrolase family protein [Oscillospiraceae bacterium]